MSKFNKPATDKTLNECGYPAYAMDKKTHLVTAVLTSFFGEPKYYGNNDSEIIKLAQELAQTEPEFLCKLACYARNVGNMRSVSHALTAVIARHARDYTRRTVRNVVVRPDDMTEIMACCLELYGKPFPNALKREIASVIQRFDEYSLAKYKGRNKSLKLRDVLRITHPVPLTKEKEELFRKVLDDDLETPYTWETELSEKGNTREVWEELIASGRLGYMAMLRNLSNIIRSGADAAPVIQKLCDPDAVRKSRQLSFRYYSAYLTLLTHNLLTPEIQKALDGALDVSVGNMEHIPGRTLIGIDVSGSMMYPVSAKSTVRCCDIAALFGAISSRMCEDATVCYFDSTTYSMFGGNDGYTIKRFGKYDSVLDICSRSEFSGGGTNISLPLIYALEKDNTRNVRPFDRVIIFSDNMCNRSVSANEKRPVQSLADKYRAIYNKDLWIHCVDLHGYGTQQFHGSRFDLISGWSDTVLSFIMLAEKGIGTLVDAIEKYEVK